MIVLAGGDLVLPDRILPAASLVIDGDDITAVDARSSVDPAAAQVVDVTGCYVAPGFVDVHVHGVEGLDTLDGSGVVAAIAMRLPRYGVTAFCPTSVACGPAALATFLRDVADARGQRAPGAARVLPAHLESNFINPDYRGAQPAECLRTASSLTPGMLTAPGYRPGVRSRPGGGDAYAAIDILAAIAERLSDVGTVTLAPELPGGLALVRELVSAGVRVSLGHSGADFDTAIAAIEAGGRQATHLFNRMPPLNHRAPGLAGAVLAREDVAAELICDGYHVHAAMVRVALAAKTTRGIMAITDGTAGSGLAVGARARLGGRTIHVRAHAAELDDGTLAGSTLTMDRAFRNLVVNFGCPIVDAAAVCATTPARELGLTGLGVIAAGAKADLVVLDRRFNVVRTLVGGDAAFEGARV